MKHNTVLNAVNRAGLTTATTRDNYAHRTYYRVQVGAQIVMWAKHDNEDNAEGLTVGEHAIRTTGTLSQVLRKSII